MRRVTEGLYWLAEKMGFCDMDEAEELPQEGVKFGDCTDNSEEKKTNIRNNPTNNPPKTDHNKGRRTKGDRV